MNKRRKIQKSLFTFKGCLLFFVMVVFVASSSILCYAGVLKMSQGNVTTAALATFANIFVLTAICTVIDYVRRKITVEKPVNDILAATENIMSGNFDIDIQPSHPWGKYNEYDLIAENITAMAKELSHNEVLKNDFISNVSHEIKTPLSVIRNYAYAIKQDGADEEKRRQYAEVLENAAQRLSRLVSDILKLNKLENQSIMPVMKQVDLAESLRESVVNFEEAMEKKQINLVCDIDESVVMHDENMLEIIWNNLLSNAVKFTPCGGEIKVMLKDSENFATVVISDSGCGMSEEVGKRIFDKFYQADKSHSQEGNGLGLALVKKVIDLCGGQINVFSEEGKGSRFTVKLRKDGK